MLFLLVPRLLPKCGLPGFIGLKGLRIDPVEVILATVHGQKGFIEALPLAMGIGFFLLLCLAIGFGSSWLATILWNLASQRLSASLCGQLIVSETLFALVYSFAWDGHWPAPAQWAASVLFTLGILASIKAHR